MLFGEIIAVYYENHMEHINTLCGHWESPWQNFRRIALVPNQVRQKYLPNRSLEPYRYMNLLIKI
jgi:hypothetical protein